jgi:NADPH:quinone reductase-like Zn-dependent oxidoreductase
MRRWVIDRHGRDSLRTDDASTPSPATGEVLVRVSAVALNARDPMMIDHGMGLNLDFPFVPASDMAGVVEVAGNGVIRFATGDRVISNFLPDWLDGRPGGSARELSYRTLGGHYPGVLSEHVCFPEGWFTAAPTTLDGAEASTLPVAGLTAWFSLVEQGRIKAGETVLLPGTGGVALFALQIAVAHGAEVIITSASEEKLARAKALGAAHGIKRETADVVEAVLALTGGRGADHVLDLIGGDNFARSVATVSVGGRISVIGLLGGLELNAPTTPILLKAPVIQGIVTGHRRALEDLVRAVDRIGLKPVIDRRYPFDDLPAALDHLDRGAFGKIVIDMPTHGS